MTEPAASEAAREAGQPGQETPSAESGLLDALGRTFASARDVAWDATELASLEARLAAATVVRMLWSAVAIALCVCAAWGLAQAGAAIWLLGRGWPLGGVLGALALVNVFGAAVLAVVVRRLSARLTFPTTRRLMMEATGYDRAAPTPRGE
ncbi:MAG: hypothetical protein PVH31_00750 [Ectothiorhodospiraceae bacterium]